METNDNFISLFFALEFSAQLVCFFNVVDGGLMSDLLISFSGGKTSAFMTQEVIKVRPDAKVVFANTGQEHPATIDFIQRCSVYFGFEVIILEALVNPQHGKGTTYKVKSLDDLAMNGEPFESVIKKYGIPNTGFPHCTRELKIHPIHSWAKDHLSADYETAIGIRADEMDRVPADYQKKRYVYPLLDQGVTKKDINAFWDMMPFTLEIPDYLGNCITCWKKSDKKLRTILEDDERHFDFFERMEKDNANCGAGSGDRRFFRKHRSVLDLKRQRDLLNDEMNNGCEESCEVF